MWTSPALALPVSCRMNVSSNFSFADNTMVIILYMGVAWNLVYVLLSPVFAYVLFVGFQQWRKPRSHSTTHADVFTFNMAALEMLTVLGSGINIATFIVLRRDLYDVGNALCYMTTLGQALFHCLVSAERYFAVVHPIAYLRLKKKGVVARNVSIAAVWLFSSIMVIVYNYGEPLFKTCSEFVIGVFSLCFIVYFCGSVLYVLVRPGPGERKRVDKSKRRAFCTIAAIAAAVAPKFVIMFVSRMVFLSDPLNNARFSDYVLATVALWFYFPSSLVMPVIFLHRRVKRKPLKD